MRQMLLRLWKDDCGALLGTEWAFVATILLLGILTSLAASRHALRHDVPDSPPACRR
jgi:hypothetical protein